MWPQSAIEYADKLARAISGRGSFRRFKDRLSDRPELVTRWHAFSDDRHRGRARSWLAAGGYTPTRILKHRSGRAQAAEGMNEQPIACSLPVKHRP